MTRDSMFKRISAFAYGLKSYAIGSATLAYAIGFIGNLWVPKSMDSPAQGAWRSNLAIDVALLALFAVQHSGMARQGFKRWITRFIPPAIERSTYVLASAAALSLLMWQWRPLGGAVWTVTDPIGRMALYAAYACGWVLVFTSTFVINHFDLFGLRQVWRNLLGREQRPLHFVTPVLYRIVRHPLYLGLLLAFWCTPTMTVTHLVFALATTAYILIAIQLEERDLVREHADYRDYQRSVPMLIPRVGGIARSADGVPAAKSN